MINCMVERAGYGEEKMKLCVERLRKFQRENKELTYHKECYKDATNSRELKRSKERYEKKGLSQCSSHIDDNFPLLVI